jgi:hypothetical protein
MPPRQRTRKRKSRRDRKASRPRLQQRGGGDGATWAILQYDNRELSDSLRACLDINRRYAKKHNYPHFLFTDNYFLPPYWVKVHLLQRLLDVKDPQTDQPLFKGVAFLDTDAVFVDHDQSLDAFVGPRRPFVAGPDITYGKNPGDAPFNAGVIIVKNTEEVKGLLRDWMAEYKPRDWYLSDGKWSTPTRWAGPSYEQGSFVEKILPKYKDTIVDIVEAPILQSMYDAGAKYETGGGNFKKDGIVVMHFSAQKKEGMLSQFLQAYKAANP